MLTSLFLSSFSDQSVLVVIARSQKDYTFTDFGTCCEQSTWCIPRLESEGKMAGTPTIVSKSSSTRLCRPTSRLSSNDQQQPERPQKSKVFGGLKSFLQQPRNPSIDHSRSSDRRSNRNSFGLSAQSVPESQSRGAKSKESEYITIRIRDKGKPRPQTRQGERNNDIMRSATPKDRRGKSSKQQASRWDHPKDQECVDSRDDLYPIRYGDRMADMPQMNHSHGEDRYAMTESQTSLIGELLGYMSEDEETTFSEFIGRKKRNHRIGSRSMSYGDNESGLCNCYSEGSEFHSRGDNRLIAAYDRCLIATFDRCFLPSTDGGDWA